MPPTDDEYDDMAEGEPGSPSPIAAPYDDLVTPVPPDPAYIEIPPAKRYRVRVRRVALLLLLTVVLVLGAGAAWTAHAIGGTATGTSVTVVIPPGATTGQIADLLARKKVIRSALAFKVLARWRGVQTTFKPGIYAMRTGLGVDAAIAKLKAGIPLKVDRFTVPEGKTINAIADIVASRTHVSRSQFLAALQAAPVPPIRPNKTVRNFEGLLFPDTYDVTPKMTAADLVANMRANFDRHAVDLGLEAGARKLGLSPYELVTLASLVEREAKTQKDRPLVASVIYNRLAKPMRLQIDATVQYAIELKTGRYKGTLLQRSDYTSVKSPYNTYLNDGLPPAPIAAPGEAALRAALHPAKTKFIYYVLCDRQGGHAFAETNSQFIGLLSRCAGVPH